MSKVIAVIELNSGETTEYSFDQKNVKHVYQACRKELGKALSTTMENDKLFWQFQHGKVSLDGDGFRHHHGYRTVKGRTK